MVPRDLVDGLSPYARLATAVLPFVVCVVLRFILGKNRLTGWLLTLGLVWFIMNMLMAPYSAGLRQEVVNLVGHWF